MSSKYPKRPHFFQIRLEAAAPAPVRLRRRGARRHLHPRSLHLSLNNKLNVVQFRRCHYRCNYIIMLKTERRSQEKYAIKILALTSLHVCHGVPNGRECLNLKIPVQY